MLRTAALATVLVLLAGCNKVPASAPIHGAYAYATPAPLAARAEQIGLQVKFTLEGYTGATPPTITVRSVTGAVYADHQPPEADGAFHLHADDRQNLVEDRLDYTWELPDGRAITGSFLFFNRLTPAADMHWQITQTEKLVIYHVAPLEPGAGARYDGAVTRAAELLGLPVTPVRTVVYICPNKASVIDFNRTVRGDDTDYSGLGTPGAVFIRGDLPLPYTTVLLAHEVTHAQGSLFRLPMLSEGISEYVALIEDARLRRVEGVQTRYSEVFAANLPRLSEQVRVGGRYSLVRLDWVPLLEPEERNAYTVGAAFMLFVRARFGDEGVRQLFAALVKDPAGIQPVKDLFGESFAAAQADFNRYLAGGEALRDAHAVFGLLDDTEG